MKVAVGSTNPTKIESVKIAFTQVWPEEQWEVIGIEVVSGVSNQPKSDRESIKGARNRAKRSLRKIRADFGVGLEGGMQKIGKHWYECGWIAVINKEGVVGVGSSAKIHVAHKVLKLILEGKELGDAIDIVFKQKDLKKREGYFGMMTNNHITRTTGYKDGVIMALSRFLTPDVFED